MRIHPVFHVHLLEPVADYPTPEHIRKPPHTVIVDGEEQYEVQEVIDSEVSRNKLYYLVQCTGCSDPTWEPAEVVTEDAREAVKVFHRKNPFKSKGKNE